MQQYDQKSLALLIHAPFESYLSNFWIPHSPLSKIFFIDAPNIQEVERCRQASLNFLIYFQRLRNCFQTSRREATHITTIIDSAKT
jgi:hypothetical protein